MSLPRPLHIDVGFPWFTGFGKVWEISGEVLMDLFLREATERIGRDDALAKIDALMDWPSFSPILKRGLGRSGAGPQGYDPLVLFKCLLIGQWHGLSDPKLERALKVRLDFMIFCGLDLHAPVPDETTHCRFRNALVRGGVFDDLLAEVCRQIEGHGLKLKEAEAAIIDATLVESAARPRTHIDAPEDRAEGEAPDDPQMHFSADPDARWVKKGSKSTLGYKAFARTDEEGFVDKVHTTPANQAESPQLETMISGSSAQRVLADKAYASKANRASLRGKHRDGIMRKGARNRPLRASEKRFNKLISKRRFRVEQCFGTMKRLFGLHRARYFGVAKTHAQLAMAAIGQNLLKAANKISLNPQTLAIA
jgi:IS5 family transposase